jgi:hypothetical protein
LLIAGLAAGILWAIPLYLAVVVASAYLLRTHEHLSCKTSAVLCVIALGIISIATQDPLWFQLELTARPIAALVSGVWSGKSAAKKAAFPIDVRALKICLYVGAVLISVVNLWLALGESANTWLMFRTLVQPVWFLGLSIAGMRLAMRKAREESTQ